MSDPREVAWVGDDPVCWCGHSNVSHSTETRACYAAGCDCKRGYSAPVQARRPIHRSNP